MMMRNMLTLSMAILMTVMVYGQDETKRTRLVIETDSGDITVELYNETPQHRDNFIQLARDGFYDGTAFHRVIDDFMVQGGNPSTKPEADVTEDGPGYQIPGEINGKFYHKKGALCAARQGDNVNPERKSSGSQFYIVEGKPFEEADLKMFEQRINQDMRNRAMQAFFAQPENKEYLSRIKTAQQERNQEEMQAIMDEVNPIIDAWMEDKKFRYTEEQKETYKTIGGTPHLDMQYTVFGEVVDGLEVVDKIAACKKNGEKPDPAIRMTVRVIE